MSAIETATRLAYGTVELDEAARAKSEEHLSNAGLLEGVDRSTCWYCGKEKAAHELAAVLNRPSKTGEGVEHLAVGVPACATCRGLFVSRKRWASAIMNGIMLPCGLLGLIGGVLAASDLYARNGLSLGLFMRPLIGLLVGVGLSAFVAAFAVSAIVPKRFRRAETLRDPRDYPPVKALCAEGWRAP